MDVIENGVCIGTYGPAYIPPEVLQGRLHPLLGPTGPAPDLSKGTKGHKGLVGPCSQNCKGPACGCGSDVTTHETKTYKHALPWYIQHLMRQTRRQQVK